jgi:hypothetical protein
MVTTPKSRGPASPRPIQPYLDWAIATKFAYLRDGDWLPLLVEFNPQTLRIESGQTSLQAFTSLKWLSDDPRTLEDLIRIPELFREPPKLLGRAKEFRFCVVLVHRDRVSALLESPEWKQTILRAELGPPVNLAGLEKGQKSDATVTPGAGLTASAGSRRVVIGLIDQGIAFTHERFRNRSGSRIAYLWRQDFMGGGSASSPGIELTAAGIDAALAAAGGDEDAVYRSIGGLDYAERGFKPLGRRRSHGTHVLDLAAGADPNEDITDRPIIAVDMPDEAVGDPAGSTLTVHAFLGLLYILQRADSLRMPNETLPVVVNLSYGPHEGPHDGNAILELVMDFFVHIAANSETPLKVVLAAGNFRQSQIHTAFQIRPQETRSLQWRLQPGGLTASLMEIWLPDAAAGGVSVTLRSPLDPQPNQRVTVSPASPIDAVKDAAGSVLIEARFHAAGGGSRSHVVLGIARTALDPAGAWGQAIAPSGVWNVDVTNNSAGPVDVRAWIKRSDTPSGHPAKGRQSYFEDTAKYRRDRPNGRPAEFDESSESHLRRRETLSGIATGERTIVVGGYRRGDNGGDMHPATYSSAGPHDNSKRGYSAPDWLESSDDSIACTGVLAAGTRSGSSVPMNGTSAAAPQAVRWIADTWLSTGVLPIRPNNLVQPGTNPSNPIPPSERPDVVGGGLRPISQRRGRPS